MDKQPLEEVKYEEEKEIPVNKKRTLSKPIDVQPLHTDSFFVKVQRKLALIDISISHTHLMIHENPVVHIYYGNILGVTVKKMDAKEKRSLLLKESDDYYVLVIHFFSKISKQKLFGGKQIIRKSFDGEYYTDSAQKAEKWRNLILLCANQPGFLVIDSVSDFSFSEVPQFKRTLLVFINPAGGSGKAPKRWEEAKAILGKLKKAGCDFVEIRTTHYKHCLEYLQKIELSELKKFDGIVTVSGDGLPHEVINGLMTRPDWQEACKIPLGAIPGGSGNAIVKNMCDKAGEECSLESAAYLIAKGRTVPIDLAAIEQSDGHKLFSFLSFNWAVISDLDIESEKYRWMGGFRFDFMGALRVLSLRKYQAKIALCQTLSDPSEMPKLDEEVPESWVKIDGSFMNAMNKVIDTFVYCLINNMPYITTKDQSAPPAQVDDGFLHYCAVRGKNAKRGKLMNTLLKLEGGLFKGDVPDKSTGLEYLKIKAFRIEPYGNRGIYSIDGERYEPIKTQGYIMEKIFPVFCIDPERDI